MASRDPRAAVVRAVSALKRVDWVSRFEDTKAVMIWTGAAAKWVWGAVSGVGAWIMISPGAALLIAGGVGTLISLFGPAIQDELRERRAWKRHQNRKQSRVHPALRKLVKKAEQVAESLQQEQLDTKRENIVLFNRNRRGLRDIAGDIDNLGELGISDIEYPKLRPPEGRVWEWEAFLTGVMQHVDEGEPEKLKTVYKGICETLERHKYWRDPDNLLRAHHAQLAKDEEDGGDGETL